MDTKRFTNILWGIVAIMLFINFLCGILEIRPVAAVKGIEDASGYRISSAGFQSEDYVMTKDSGSDHTVQN